MNNLASQKGFKIIHLNIRSLVSKYEQLRFELEKVDIDIFCISETWLTEGVDSNILNIRGYNLERFDRQHLDVDTGLPKRGGGLCVYYNKQMSCNISKWEQYCVSSPDLELQVLEFRRKNARDLILFNVYRPPNGNVDLMIQQMNMVISNIQRLERKDLLVLGDFNVNMLSDNTDMKKVTRFGQLNDLNQLIKGPTRCTATTSSTIDLMFSSVTHVHSAGVLDMFLSDHMPIYLVKKMNTKKMKQHITFMGRTYRNYSANKLHERINNEQDLDSLLLKHDPVEIWGGLSDSLVNIADDMIPQKEYRVKAEKPAWLTDELLNLKNDRDYFFKKAKITGNQGDWFVARNLRNRVNIAMRSAIADYIKDKLNHNRQNPKKFWNIIQTEIVPNNKDKTFNFENSESGNTYEQHEIPNLINTFFAENGPNLARKIPRASNNNEILGDQNGENFELREFTMEELMKCIKEISIYKSSGIPNLSARFIKDVMLFIPHVFLHLYNTVKETCIFPNRWKIATVIPIPKCSNPKEPSELRPVSLLPIVGKIVEKLIHAQLSTFLEGSNYLSEDQHGFRKGYSTTSASSKFVDEIVLGLDKGKYTLAVFLDIKKAFDTIDHKIILQKLKRAGVGIRTCSLLQNYLDKREQCVLYKGHRSKIRNLVTGVPQGSTLGPLLFLIYVNDLPKLFENTKCMMFADDTVLYQSHNGLNELYMYDWCNNNYIEY